jgi:ribonuclease P protein component
MIACPNDERDQIVRFGFVINKKYGKAVKRNRIKRQLKEIFRGIENNSIKNMDFVIIVNNAISDLGFSEIKTAVMNSMKKFMY